MSLPSTDDIKMKWRTMPLLSDMPQRIMHQIVGNTDRLSLENARECSAWMQERVDGSLGFHEKLSISLCSNMVELELDQTIHNQNKLKIMIINKEHGYTIIHSKLPPKYVEGGNYLVAAAQEFCKIFFAYPTSHVKKVNMEFAPWRDGDRLDESSMAPFVQALHESVKINDLLSVENLDLTIEKNEGCVSALLSIFKPKVLKSLYIQTDNNLSSSVPVETLIFLKQWKHIESLMIRGWPLENVRFEWFMHIGTLWLEIDSLTVAFAMLAVEKFRAGFSSKYTVYYAHRCNGIVEYFNRMFNLEKRNIWKASALNGHFLIELKEDRLLVYPTA